MNHYISNQTIAIRFLDKVTSKNVENFIKDHIPEYYSVVKNLKFEKHQLCVIHLVKLIQRKVKEIIKKKNLTTDEIKKLKEHADRIIGIFYQKPKKSLFLSLINFLKDGKMFLKI